MIRSADGRRTGIDIDRLVLRSAAGGEASTAKGPLRAEVVGDAEARPEVEVLHQADDSLTVRVTGAEPGTPLWVDLGQSYNAGWTASIDGDDLGAPALVDGFANGWLVDPREESFEVALTFAPQHRVDLALWFSAAAALLCLGLALQEARAIARRHHLPAPGALRGLDRGAVAHRRCPSARPCCSPPPSGSCPAS